jgi:hypothetical protein
VPSWFADGKVVFVKDYNLYLASVDGTGSERLTDDKDGTLYRPSVSPDGRWIACHGFIPEGRYGGDGIILLRADGTGMRRIITSASELRPDAGPSWSPDGKRIVFSGYRGRLEAPASTSSTKTEADCAASRTSGVEHRRHSRLPSALGASGTRAVAIWRECDTRPSQRGRGATSGFPAPRPGLCGT